MIQVPKGWLHFIIKLKIKFKKYYSNKNILKNNYLRNTNNIRCLNFLATNIGKKNSNTKKVDDCFPEVTRQAMLDRD